MGDVQVGPVGVGTMIMKNERTRKEKDLTGLIGRVCVTTYKAGTKEILRRSLWIENLIVSGAGGYGRNIIARRLAGDNTYSGNVKYGEIGTGTASPANSDTALATPTARTSIVTGSVSNNIASLQFFFSDAALANGTYHEFGSFIDGTSTIGTGRMWNHVLFGTAYVKSTGEDTTIEVDITIN